MGGSRGGVANMNGGGGKKEGETTFKPRELWAYIGAAWGRN